MGEKEVKNGPRERTIEGERRKKEGKIFSPLPRKGGRIGV